MDKVCEYCKVLRPVVYCKADSANLCLPCDVKIHSANALSNRHSRTLLCELCRFHWAYIKCSNHHMFMCRTCDRSQHNVLSQHQRRVINCYIGCPSAKDLAELWGFDLNGFDDSTRQDQSISTTGGYVNAGAVNCDTLMQSCTQAGCSSVVSKVKSVTSQSVVEYELRSNRKHAKEIYQGTTQRSICFILQQVLDLNRLQLSDGTNSSSLVRCREQTDASFSENESTWELENNLDQHLQYSFGLDSDLQQTGSPNTDLHVDSFPSPFSQLDPLTTSTGESAMEVDSIWQSKTPDQSGQLWSQNMQDLGVCEELECLDELSMPDIDLTFRNFEELFGGGEHEPRRIPDNRSKAYAYVEKDISFDKPEYGCASGMKV